MFHTFLRPGQGFQKFERLTHTCVTSSSGRPINSSSQSSGFIYGIITATTPEEKEQWGTTEHPVSHKIVQQGIVNKAKEGDILVLNDLCYYVHKKPRNPGGLNHFTIYYCEERSGLNGE